jgi:hypothetical protein
MQVCAGIARVASSNETKYKSSLRAQHEKRRQREKESDSRITDGLPTYPMIMAVTAWKLEVS